MPSSTSKNTSKNKPTDKHYIELGKAVAAFYENGYLDKRSVLRMAFLKGVAGGLGGVLGATVLAAALLWGLSFFDELPIIGNFVKSVQETAETK